MSEDRPARLADELPRSVEPPRDLWPAIEAAIDREDAAPIGRRAWPIRIGVAMATLAAAAWLVAVSGPPEPERPEVTPPPWAEGMRSASASLEAAVRGRDDLDPATIEVIERNLAVIDAAIVECEAALSEHRDDPRLAHALERAWQARIHLLAGARDLHPIP